MKTNSGKAGSQRAFVSFPDLQFADIGANEDLDFHSSHNIGIGNDLPLSSGLEQNFDPTIINRNHYNISEEEWTCLFNNGGSNSSSQDLSNNNNESSSSTNSNHPIFSSTILSSINIDDVLKPQPQACNVSWDGLLCWPETPAGELAILPCFSQLNRVRYDTSRSATRFCQDDGNWQNRTDYTNCIPLPTLPGMDDKNLVITTGVYFVGYSLSLCLLGIAMIIFISFKELRCLRNKIHTHLIIAYILSDTLWLMTSFMSSQGREGVDIRSSGHHVSCITFILLHYFHMTKFFWMFVEGLYLYVLVVQTFVADNIKLKVYVAIGWGIPLMLVSGWSFAKWMTQSTHMDINTTDPEFGNTAPLCLWLNENVYDWFYKAPVIFVLAANIAFLSQIMWVLITKLRSAMNPETQQSRKAAKALLVLMPLLGITYLLILTGSKQTPAYEYVRALLISTQGFLVALFYCFLNGEVRVALRHQWNRIREVGPSFACCGCEFDSGRQRMQQMREWSPRSRTESIRLYTPSGQTFRKRESTASDATSMTILHRGSSLNGNNLVSTMTVLNKNNKFSTTTTVIPQTSKLINSIESNTLV